MTTEITLLEKISGYKFLENAWNQLNKYNKDSHGLSGETIEHFERSKEDKLKSISEKLKNNTYQFSPNRGVLIPKKGNNSFRPLQIPEICDRVVIKAIALELEELFSETIKKSEGYSFAYQKNIGVKDALFKIRELYDLGYKIALEADLINFFGTVDRNELLENTVFKQLTDSSINDLIISSLSQEIGNCDEFNPEQLKFFDSSRKGIPQGNALSPLLSNLYLSGFDIKLIQAGYKLVRYADDFVILCQSESECQGAYLFAKERLEELNLRIHPLGEGDKTKITIIEKDNLTFLSITFDGKDLFPSRENFERLKNKIWELNRGKVQLNLLEYLVKIRNKHDGWVSSFIYSDIMRYAKELDYEINRALYFKLNSIGWKLSQSKLAKIPKNFSKNKSSRFCLSPTQRQFSGIPLTNQLINEKQKEK